jgi:hypothetical protein
LRPNRYKEQGASLIGALQCPKGASEGGALRVLCGVTTLQLNKLARHCPWHPTIHLGRQDGWRIVLGSIYGKRLPKGPFVKNVFHKGQNKKITPIYGPELYFSKSSSPSAFSLSLLPFFLGSGHLLQSLTCQSAPRR